LTALAFSPSGVLYVATGDGGIFRINDGAKSRDKAAAGRQIYRQHCASCHGGNGEGAAKWKSPNAQGELPAPPHDPTGHSWRHSDAVLYKMVAFGWRDPFNKTKRLTMPPYQEILSASEIRSVIGYLKTLWTDEQRLFQQRENRK
jgi:mono/diheme cytochrome c family protein